MAENPVSFTLQIRNEIQEDLARSPGVKIICITMNAGVERIEKFESFTVAIPKLLELTHNSRIHQIFLGIPRYSEKEFEKLCEHIDRLKFAEVTYFTPRGNHQIVICDIILP